MSGSSVELEIDTSILGNGDNDYGYQAIAIDARLATHGVQGCDGSIVG